MQLCLGGVDHTLHGGSVQAWTPLKPVHLKPVQARAPVGTIYYMAPEVLLLASYKGSALEPAVSKRVGEKMDVWSLGVCLFELAAGR